MPESALEAIEAEGLTLTRTEEKEGVRVWEARGLAAGEQLDRTAAGELARKIAGLQVSGVLGIEADPEYRQESPELVLTLKPGGGGTVTWTLSKPEQGEEYVLKSSEHPWYFELAAWSARPIVEEGRRSALVIAPEPAPDAAVASPASGEPQQPGNEGTAAATVDAGEPQTGVQEGEGDSQIVQ